MLSKSTETPKLSIWEVIEIEEAEQQKEEQECQTNSQTDSHTENFKPEKDEPEIIEKVEFEPTRYRWLARTRSCSMACKYGPGNEYATINTAQAAANEWFRKHRSDID